MRSNIIAYKRKWAYKYFYVLTWQTKIVTFANFRYGRSSFISYENIKKDTPKGVFTDTP